jgi:hypothetical protein
VARTRELTTSVVQQLGLLAALPVTVDHELRAGGLRWLGRFLPSPVSREYLVEIAYEPPRRPRVVVVAPELTLPAGVDELPHVYEGDELCLCFPGEWRLRDVIATTLVPWISEWLLHYELWMVNQRWLGGGHE